MPTQNADESPPKERNIFVRILFVVLLFIPFYYVTNALVQGVVAGIAAGIHTNGYAAGAAVAGPAITDFYNKYGIIVLNGQLLAYAALCFLRWVPGVGKYKRGKL